MRSTTEDPPVRPMTSKPLVTTLVTIVFVGSALSVGYTTGAFTDTEELEVTVAGNVPVDEYEGGPPNGDVRDPPGDRGPHDADTDSAAGSAATARCDGDGRLENGTTDGAADTALNPCDGSLAETDPKPGSDESSGADENETGMNGIKTDGGAGEPDGSAVGSDESDGDATDVAENESVGLTEATDSTPTNDTVSDTSNRTEATDTANSTADDSDGNGENTLENATDDGNDAHSVGENESSDGTESSTGNASNDENGFSDGTTSTSETETSSGSEDETGDSGTDSSGPTIAGEAADG